MKTIIKRLGRLEDRVASPGFQGPSPAEILFERRRRRLEASGLRLKERPLGPLIHARGNSLLIADVLRNRRALRCTEAGSQGAEISGEVT
jgi:hypothetical protein